MSSNSTLENDYKSNKEMNSCENHTCKLYKPANNYVVWLTVWYEQSPKNSGFYESPMNLQRTINPDISGCIYFIA